MATAATDRSRQVQDWVDRSRDGVPLVDLAARLRDRSQQAFLAVMGAALALRLFLFVVPVMVSWVGLLVMVSGRPGLQSFLDRSSIAGALASQIEEAIGPYRSTGALVFATGAALTLWAGRNLAVVLAACSAGAWRVDARHARMPLRSVLSVTGLVATVVVVNAIFNHLRREYGLAVGFMSLVTAAGVYALAWFFGMWSLPRATRDVSALVPGALLLGVTLSGLQWVMNYYLPARLERSSEMMGATAVAIVALGYFFIIGRFMAIGLVLNAVTYEKFGTLSEFLFGLPLLRRVPARFPRAASHFGWIQPDDGDDEPSVTNPPPDP